MVNEKPGVVSLRNKEAGVEFIFPVKPKEMSIKSGQKIAKTSIPGKDGDVKQNLGKKQTVFNISGTLFGGHYHSKNGQIVDFRELRRQFQIVTAEKVIFDFTAILSNYIGSTKVIIEDWDINLREGKANQFDYSITLEEWKPFDIKEKATKNLVNKVSKEELLNSFKRLGGYTIGGS